MFCSVAVGRLRQAYKSPAITGLGCVFKTLWVRIGARARACVCIRWGRHNGVRGGYACALPGAAAGQKDAVGMLRSRRRCPALLHPGRPVRGAGRQLGGGDRLHPGRGLESAAILLLFPKSPGPLKLDPPRFALPQPQPGRVSSPARHSLLLNKISLGSF